MAKKPHVTKEQTIKKQGFKKLEGLGKISTFKGHTSYVSSVTITQDAKKVVSGSYDKTLNYR